jgi:AraC-like DNA-binding protein
VKSVLVSSGGARAVGFRATAHFTTTFRGLTGMTPTKYRTLKASEAPES